MSKTSGEKARANVAKKRRTAQRAKDRAKLASIRAGASGAKKDESKEAGNG